MPINPEDEDDVVPDQHAAFGIAKATKEVREPGWRDLRLGELVSGEGEGGEGAQTGGSTVGGNAVNGVRGTGGVEGVGPARGGVRVPVGVRNGMRSVGSGLGSELRG